MVASFFGESQGRRPAEAPARESSSVEYEVEDRGTERVVTFSDAVVAIAITLLALDLPPVTSGHGLANGQLLHELRGQWPEYLAFLISFLVIGNHWATHRRVFRYVSRMNGVVSRLNMLWLLMMVLTPVAARILAGSGAFGVRFACYALIQVIATGSLMLMNRESARAGLLRPDAPERARHPDLLPALAFCVMFLVSIPVAFVTPWAYVFWGGVPTARRVLKSLTAGPAGRHQ